MDTHEVTNAEWRVFAEETGYKTIAELPVDWEEVKKLLPPNSPRPPEENLRAGSLVFTPRPGIIESFSPSPMVGMGHWSGLATPTWAG